MKYLGMTVEDVRNELDEQNVEYDYVKLNNRGAIHIGGYQSNDDILEIKDGVVIDVLDFKWIESL